MRRLAAAAIAVAFLAGPLSASEVDIKAKQTREEAAKEKEKAEAEAKAKAGQPAKPTPPAEACASPAVPPTGSTAFFNTIEDIYGFEGSVTALSAVPPAPPVAVKDKPTEASKAD